MLKHYTIPIFIPELACPHQCVFCDQKKISGQEHIPDLKAIKAKIKTYLKTIPEKRSRVEIGFFGGSFTGLSHELQKEYLQVAAEFVQGRRVEGIRLSTRPDYIDEKTLLLLKKHKVITIELGAQSMDQGVLTKSGRGHTVEDVERASKMIIDHGFELGLQMMIGLPGDTREKALHTAKRIVELGAKNTRIYPTLVIKGTQLEQMMIDGKYTPMRLTEAILWAKDLYLYFEDKDIDVIRIGLHPSEELSPEHGLAGGPFHASFKELVMTEIWKEHLFEEIEFKPDKSIIIYVPHDQLNFAIGHKSENAHLLENHFVSVKIKTDVKLIKRAFYVDYY
jgi:histone acetyltransferase (RNA polymerase elongator complex component)